MGEAEAFKTGEFLGRAVVYIILALIVFSVLRAFFKKLIKKNIPYSIEDIGNKKPSRLSKVLKVVAIGFIAFLFISTVLYLSIGKTDSRGWTAESKASFKEGILNTCGSKATELCTCIADYLIDRYSLDELSKLQNLEPGLDNPPKEVLDATKACFSDSK